MRDVVRTVSELSERGVDVWRAVGENPHQIVMGTDRLYSARVLNVVEEDTRVKVYFEDIPTPDYYLFVWDRHLYVIPGDETEGRKSMGFSFSNPYDLNEYNREKTNFLTEYHIDSRLSEIHPESGK